MPRCLPLLLPLLFFACSGHSYSADDETECARIVADYEELYGLRYGDHGHADFDGIVEVALPHIDSGAPSCLTLAGVVDSIDATRTDRVATNPNPIVNNELTAGTMFGLGVAGLLGLISAIASIWLLVVAFSENVWWGLGSIFVPFVSLVFVIMFWEKTKRPFLISLGAQACAVAIVVLAVS